MYLNNMTEGPKTPCFFYFRISPGFPCNRIIKIKIQDLEFFLFFNVFVFRNFYLGFQVPWTRVLRFYFRISPGFPCNRIIKIINVYQNSGIEKKFINQCFCLQKFLSWCPRAPNMGTIFENLKNSAQGNPGGIRK